MSHLVLNIYSNGEYVFEYVNSLDLNEYIEYNKVWRFGRLIYVDGKRVYNGCIENGYLDKYDKIAKNFYVQHNRSLM